MILNLATIDADVVIARTGGEEPSGEAPECAGRRRPMREPDEIIGIGHHARLLVGLARCGVPGSGVKHAMVSNCA